MNKVKSFVKQFIATVKGDSTEAAAQKVLRQADSALQTQIATLTGDTISLEDKLADAKEKQILARVNNGNVITYRDAYVEGLLDAKNEVTYAEEALKTHTEKLTFLKEELAALSAEVDA